MLDDPKVQLLSPELFRFYLTAAVKGIPTEANPFLDFIEGPFGVGSDPGRLPIAEWRVVRSRIFKRDDYTCGYCGERGGRLECDHIIPVSRGGSHDDNNLRTACFKCNRSKHAKLVEEWAR